MRTAPQPPAEPAPHDIRPRWGTVAIHGLHQLREWDAVGSVVLPAATRSGTIAAEVRRHRGFRFADVREAFAGGGVCAASARILGVTRPGFASFHPTARGQASYARVIRRRL